MLSCTLVGLFYNLFLTRMTTADISDETERFSTEEYFLPLANITFYMLLMCLVIRAVHI